MYEKLLDIGVDHRLITLCVDNMVFIIPEIRTTMPIGVVKFISLHERSDANRHRYAVEG